MEILKVSSWICPAVDTKDVCPIFRKQFISAGEMTGARLLVTAKGVYEVAVNGVAVGNFFMAPGWTCYKKRHLYQEYDIFNLLCAENVIEITVGRGWHSDRYGWGRSYSLCEEYSIIAAIEITYRDGTSEVIHTDESWEYAKSPVLFSEIFDGETYDARVVPCNWTKTKVLDAPKDNLIPQDGEIVCEHERIKPIAVITSPGGETILDFGQNLTGRLNFQVVGKAGDYIEISHAEILDANGNFYTENLRTAKQHIKYICKDGFQEYKPHFAFMGFRYIRLDQYEYDVNPNDFTAIVTHSDIMRTGSFKCSNPKLNKLFDNIIWSQKSNFLDVPTDCPQRDERLGWTGDVQMFIRTASYNFDTEKFFKKWLRDLAAEQYADGGIPNVVPNVLKEESGKSAGWGDAAVICPWQLYLTYGDKEVLDEQYDSMRKWVEYIRHTGNNELLWDSGKHYGDWLGLDSPDGSLKGASDDAFIATAFYAYSTGLLVKASKILGKNCEEYEQLYKSIVTEFQKTFVCKTQTEHVLSIYFDLASDKQKTADALAEMIVKNGVRLTTGFIGTPYLLHALSENGYANLAYSLLLREEFPSWLFEVNMGATTMWEHWDGLGPNGSIWDSGMNSFNHYAYGAVADWLYCAAAGIRTDMSRPGFEHVILTPIADRRLAFLEASVETRFGTVASRWSIEDNYVKYEFRVPNSATAIINGEVHELKKGMHTFTDILR